MENRNQTTFSVKELKKEDNKERDTAKLLELIHTNGEIEKELNSLILSRVSVNDSYFYGEMFFTKNFNPVSFNDTYMCRIVLNLYNSTEFRYPHRINEIDRKNLDGDKIILSQSLDCSDMMEKYLKRPPIEFIKQLFYDSLSRYLCSELMKKLGHKFTLGNDFDIYDRPSSFR
jgi:hypothetical protein